jgi:hypothetical protein
MRFEGGTQTWKWCLSSLRICACVILLHGIISAATATTVSVVVKEEEKELQVVVSQHQMLISMPSAKEQASSTCLLLGTIYLPLFLLLKWGVVNYSVEYLPVQAVTLNFNFNFEDRQSYSPTPASKYPNRPRGASE